MHHGVENCFDLKMARYVSYAPLFRVCSKTLDCSHLNTCTCRYIRFRIVEIRFLYLWNKYKTNYNYGIVSHRFDCVQLWQIQHIPAARKEAIDRLPNWNKVLPNQIHLNPIIFPSCARGMDKDAIRMVFFTPCTNLVWLIRDVLTLLVTEAASGKDAEK